MKVQKKAYVLIMESKKLTKREKALLEKAGFDEMVFIDIRYDMTDDELKEVIGILDDKRVIITRSVPIELVARLSYLSGFGWGVHAENSFRAVGKMIIYLLSGGKLVEIAV